MSFMFAAAQGNGGMLQGVGARSAKRARGRGGPSSPTKRIHHASGPARLSLYEAGMDLTVLAAPQKHPANANCAHAGAAHEYPPARAPVAQAPLPAAPAQLQVPQLVDFTRLNPDTLEPKVQRLLVVVKALLDASHQPSPQAMADILAPLTSWVTSLDLLFQAARHASLVTIAMQVFEFYVNGRQEQVPQEWERHEHVPDANIAQTYSSMIRCLESLELKPGEPFPRAY